MLFYFKHNKILSALLTIGLFSFGSIGPIRPLMAQEKSLQEAFEQLGNSADRPVSHQQCLLHFPAWRTDSASIQELRASLAKAERKRDLLEAGGILNELGNIYRENGRLGDAKQAYQQSIKFAKALLKSLSKSSPKSSQAVSLEAASISGVAYTQLELGDYEMAIQGFQTALKMRRTLKDPFLEALTLNNIANAYAAQGDSANAEQFYAQATLVIANAPPIPEKPAKPNAKTSAKSSPKVKRTHPIENWVYGNRRSLAWSIGELSLDETDGKVLTQLDRANYAAFINNMTALYQTESEYERAFMYYDYALRASEMPTQNANCRWRILSNKARLLIKQGNLKAAVTAYGQATVITSSILNNAGLSAGERSTYRKVIQPIYQEYATLLRRSEFGGPEAAARLLKQLQTD